MSIKSRLEKLSPPDKLEVIRKRVRYNTERIQNLVQLYEKMLAEGDKQPDILRAAVVLLHATMEDALRNTLAWKLPTAPASALERISFSNVMRRPQINLAELREFGDQTVGEIVERTITNHLTRTTFNRMSDVTNALDWLKIETKPFRKFGATIDAMTSRRHQIVHRGDRKDADDFSHGRPEKIEAHEVKRWVKKVCACIDLLMGKLKAGLTEARRLRDTRSFQS